MSDSKFEEYALLDAQEKQIKEKKEVLRAEILSEMVSEGSQKVETALGSFSVSKLKKWTYPESVTELGEKFKAAKAKAESTGDATYTEEESLRFTSAKI